MYYKFDCFIEYFINHFPIICVCYSFIHGLILKTPLVEGKVIDSNLGPTPRHNKRNKIWFLLLSGARQYKKTKYLKCIGKKQA